MQKLLIGLLFFILSIPSFSQEKYTVSGNIKDAENGEDLIGAAVTIQGTSNGAVTNFYGFYSLSLETGDYTLNISYLGFAPSTANVGGLAGVYTTPALYTEVVGVSECLLIADQRMSIGNWIINQPASGLTSDKL